MDRLCAVLDTVDGGDSKKIRWVGTQPTDTQAPSEKDDKGKGKGKQNQNNGPKRNNRDRKKAPDRRGPLICWDCGQEGHTRTKCPEHFKYKPKDGGRPAAAPGTPPPEEEGNEQGTQ
jgi:hypothetical protein